MATLKYKDKTNNVWKKISGYIQLGNDVPIGTILPFSGTTIPDGYLLCNGTSLLRTDYPDLFNVIGTTYGSVDSTHFNLPNIQGKIPVGLDTTDTDFNTLGKTGGEKTHTLTEDEIPSMNVHMTKNSWYDRGGLENGGAANRRIVAGGATGGDTSYIIGTVNGGGQAHNNLQPYIVQNFIIKAKMSGTINKNNTYSTSESKTGETWIDGKPIYRKVISLTASTSTKSLSISSIISNVDSIWINCSKSFYKIAAGGSGMISDWEVSGARFRAVIDIGTLYYACSSSGYSQAEIMLEYTKTTD